MIQDLWRIYFLCQKTPSWLGLRHVPDQNKTQEICDKVILENVAALKSVPDCYKNQEMCNKAVNNYPLALEFIPEWFMTQKNVWKSYQNLFFYNKI